MDLRRVVVGTSECPIRKLELLIVPNANIRENWSVLARRLGVSEEKIQKLRRDYINLDKIVYSDVIADVLETWVAMSGSSAQLETLIGIIEEDCNAGTVGESIRLQFNLPCKGWDEKNQELNWTLLSPAYQHKIEDTLRAHLSVDGPIQYDKLSQGLLLQLMTGSPPTLFKSTLQPPLKFYIQRKLISRNVLSIPKISGLDAKDIFLFEGVEQHDLSILANDEMTAQSSEQLSGVTCNWITIDQPSHYQKISARTRHPVHLIRFEDDKFRLIETCRDISLMQHCTEEPHLQETLDESDFCSALLKNKSSHAICISDTPGMGKSMLLSHLAHTMSELFPERCVVFSTFSTFMGEFAKGNANDFIIGKIQSAVQNLATDNILGESVLQSRLLGDDVTVELLLDGFDELPYGDIPQAFEILVCAKSLKFVRIWVSTRPHFLEQIESSLGVLGYHIKPFDQDDQVNFLISYWSQHDTGLLHQDKLEEFAQNVLQNLKSKMDSTDQDVAGIPLQCFMLGEVYEDDAKEYARIDGKRPFRFPIEGIVSITSLYQALIKNRVRKYKAAYGTVKFDESQLNLFHKHASLQLLFPDACAGLTGLAESNLEMDELLKVGIMEMSGGSAAYQFIHRTIAEYLAAEFVISQISQNINSESHFPKFLFEVILECRRASTIAFEFVNRVVCYFINGLFSELEELPALSKKGIYMKYFQSSDIMLKIASACVVDNFVYIFEFFDRNLAFKQHSKDIFNLQFVLTATEKSNLSLVKLALSRFKSHNKFSLEDKVTVLNTAMRRGEYFLIEYLIKKEGLRDIVTRWDLQSTSLIHECVRNSNNNSPLQLEQKLQIIRLLIGINKKLLEVEADGSTPILTSNVHICLLLELLKLGANVLATDTNNDSLLHLNRDRMHLSSNEFNMLVSDIPETAMKKLMTASGSNGDTPLINLVKVMDPLGDTFHIFKTAGANFRDTNELKEEVTVIAIKHQRHEATIRKLIQLSELPQNEIVNLQGQTLLHVAAKYGNVSALQALIDSKYSVAATDKDGNSPLHTALTPESFGKASKNYSALAKVLCENGAAVDALNNEGETALQVAMSNDDMDLETFNFLKSRHEWEWTQAQTLNAVKFVLTKLVLRYRRRKVIANMKDVVLKPTTETSDGDGNTLLHLAAQKQDEKEVLFLLKHGAKVKRLNDKHQTPLHSAASNFKSYVALNILKILIDEGADPFLKDSENCTFLHTLLQEGTTITSEDFHEFVEYLKKRKLTRLFNICGGEYNATPLHLSLLRFVPLLETLDSLKQSGVVDFNSTDRFGRPPLSYAINANMSVVLVSHLVGCGADWKMCHEIDQDSLLHVAARAGNLEAVKLLLDLGGLEVNAINVIGNTPLHYAVLFGGPQSTEATVKLLMENGALSNIPNAENDTPLSAVMKQGNLRLFFLINGPTQEYVESTVYSALCSESLDLETLETISNKVARSEIDSHLAFTMMRFVLKKLKKDDSEKRREVARRCISNLDVNIKENSSGDTLLHVAAESHDEFELDFLLTCGADTNLTNEQMQTPLHKAVSVKRKDFALNMIKTLIQNDTNVFQKDLAESTFLHVLLMEGPDVTPSEFHELTEALLEKGHGDIFSLLGYDDKYSPLHLAFLHIDVEERTISHLHSHGVSMNTLDDEGKPVIFFAVEGERSVSCLEELVRCGADWRLRDSLDSTVLHVAAEFLNVEALEFFTALEEPLDINLTNVHGNTPLHMVLFSDHAEVEEVVESLVRLGVDKEARNGANETPYSLALKRDDFAQLKPILEGKPNVRSKFTGAEVQPGISRLEAQRLKQIAENSQPNEASRMTDADEQSLLRLGLECLFGLDINCREELTGNTFLHSAAENQDEHKVHLLLKLGADVHAVNRRRETVLHKAAQDSFYNVSTTLIKLLLGAGVDAYAKSDRNETFFHLLLGEKSLFTPRQLDELTEYFIERGYVDLFSVPGLENGYTPLHLVVLWMPVKEAFVRLLHSFQVNLNEVSGSGETLFLLAVQGQKGSNFLNCLIELGCEWKTTDNHGCGPLHYAAQYGNLDALEYLVAQGVFDINGQDRDGDSPLHCALKHGNKKNVMEIARFLVDCGADLDLKCMNGLTPYDVVERGSDWQGSRERLLRLLKSQ